MRTASPAAGVNDQDGLAPSAEDSMPWIYLFAAGVLEVLWAYAMKQSDGFSRLGPALATLAAMPAPSSCRRGFATGAPPAFSSQRLPPSHLACTDPARGNSTTCAGAHAASLSTPPHMKNCARQK